ncbi:hypothetical protein [Pseudofrankia sp. DC12]|uniref:hypothetical protein n=1 Tax=Pseudofrankia sp. DC12 TaxID=683315 RepID=UPI0005F84066|nr:hypothetical protein [Pseudofrankia sp. DC12]
MDTDLSGLTKEIAALTAELGLVTLPVRVTPGVDGPEAELGPENLPAADFVRVANQVGARLLYTATATFDYQAFADDLPANEDPEGQKARRRLLRTAKPRDGEIIDVELAFAHAGVLNRWELTAPWHARLLTEVEELRPANAPASYRTIDPAERDLRVERFVTELVAIPAFRRRSGSDRASRAVVMDQHPEMADLLTGPDSDYVANSVLRQARDKIGVECERIYQALRDQLPTLAAELAADEAFRRLPRIDGRRTHVDDFLAARNDSYPPPSWYREILLDTHPLQGGKVAPANTAATLY